MNHELQPTQEVIGSYTIYFVQDGRSFQKSVDRGIIGLCGKNCQVTSTIITGTDRNGLTAKQNKKI